MNASIPTTSAGLAELVLRTKRNEEQEYTLHLFEKCNLSCSFCWQDHTATQGVDSILDKIPPMVELFEKETQPKIVVNIMGGEVFDDSIFNDDLEDDYVLLCMSLARRAERFGKQIRFNFVSNLVTNQPDRIRKLFKRLLKLSVAASLSVSYDSKGRFNREQFKRFQYNMHILRDLAPGVAMLLTKPVIKEIMRREDAYFEFLYVNGYEIYFDYYTPTDNHLSIGPSDVDLLRVFSFLIDHYPKVQPIKGWIENQVNALSCRSSKLVLPDGTQCMCGNLQHNDPKLITFYKSDIRKNNNGPIEDRFITERDCLSCEYFSRCQMGCFMQHDFKNRTQLNECVFKLTFDKIVKGKEPDFESLETHFGH